MTVLSGENFSKIHWCVWAADQTQKYMHADCASRVKRFFKFYFLLDGEALYSQQKQDQGLTVAQIMKSLLENSDLN